MGTMTRTSIPCDAEVRDLVRREKDSQTWNELLVELVAQHENEF